MEGLGFYSRVVAWLDLPTRVNRLLPRILEVGASRPSALVAVLQCSQDGDNHKRSNNQQSQTTNSTIEDGTTSKDVHPDILPDDALLDTGLASEYQWDYCPGGLHPTHIGEVFNNRYEVLHKLGFGAFSTVWLVHDLHTTRNVSMKILSAEQSANSNELNVMKYLTKQGASHPGYKHIAHLLDNFYIEGPNGRHLCLITDVLGPKCFDFDERAYLGLDAPVAKNITTQLLTALHLLHACGVLHGDLHPGNVVFRINHIATLPLATLRETIGTPHTVPTRREDWSKKSGDPRYIVQCLDQDSVFPECASWDIVLIDFGGSFFEAHPPPRIQTPSPFMPPEAIFGKTFSRAIDIWSVANTVCPTSSGCFNFKEC